jgi:hypothetical protein
MNEEELRALVRDAVARHLGAARGMTPAGGAPLVAVREHASHAVFAIPTGAEGEGPCIIEPTVMCNHCGYCKSMGH